MKNFSVLMITVFSLTTNIFSQVEFTPHAITSGVMPASSVYAVDVDSDGDMDVLSASKYDNNIAWYENVGNENFIQHTITNNADGALSVFAVDVDGDGDMDVLSASHFDSNYVFYEGKIAWYENDGNENFIQHTIATSEPFTSIYAVDVDGDGDIDVLSASLLRYPSYNSEIAWYENNGNENFTAHTITTSEAFTSVYAVDVDGDGDMDVLSASDNEGYYNVGEIAWYENDGNENFTLHTITGISEHASSVYAVDVDGDGDMDVLSACYSHEADAQITWYENDGNENFTPHTITDHFGVTALSVYAVDVDSDGDMDVLASFCDEDDIGGISEITWYENDGNENFTPHTIATVCANSVYAVDVDGDGDMDVLSAGYKSDWYENDGNENFAPHSITTNAYGAHSVYAVDVDSDGDMDVLSASTVDNKIAWYENDGYENFTSHTITTNATGALSVYAVDVDGDGDMDMLSASSGQYPSYNGEIAWYENDGNENFTPHTIATVWASSVYAVDVDGDGDMDVLSASTVDNKIAWYENDGNEDFTSHTITTNVHDPVSVYALDVDGDGDIDMLSASYFDDKIAWYENDGNENFTAHIITTSANGAWSVYAIDVDGDGDIDVLSANSYDDQIAWYENDGNEYFTVHTITTSTECTESVYAVDVDGDGDIDVLSASRCDHKIAWYENDGNETFTNHTITTGAFGSRSVYAVDVDGDGDIDILSASYLDGKIAWYENLSPPIPVELTSFTASTSKGKVTLNWSTATEINNQMFEIERSRDDGQFVTIGYIEGHGTTTEIQNYQYIDDISDIQATSLSYRLKQIDYDGSYEYSDVVEVTNLAPTDFALHQNYPNPFNPVTTISYSLPVKSQVELVVYNTLGESVVQLVNEEKEAGRYKVEFSATGGATTLPSGIYFYRIQAGSFSQIKKMILLK